MVRFEATVELNGKTATGVEVPADVVDALGAGRRPPVRVTIRDYAYRSTIVTMSGRFMLPISAEVRAGAAVSAGDRIEVDVVLDTAVREVEVPADFAAALDASPAARAFFDQLSYSNKQWHTLQVTGAKTAETRERRIAKSVAALSEGRVR
ncbi:MAG: DUF1905 domain-containing protein [Hamadaea sp.]|nr:DUF1905 domain-containing protein [Hamadaea sp.]